MAWEGAPDQQHTYLGEKLPGEPCLKDTTEGQHPKDGVGRIQSSGKEWGQGH